MNWGTIPEFDKDFKKLFKKFDSLDSDLEGLKKYLKMFHANNLRAHDPVKIPTACGETYISYKVRKIACKSLKGRGNQSGLRVIYVYEPEKNKITLIEIYFKSNNENEDKARLKEFISNI